MPQHSRLHLLPVFALCFMSIVANGQDQKNDLGQQLSEARAAIPKIEATIIEKSRYTAEGEKFYKRDFSDWKYEKQYEWACADNRLGRAETVPTTDGDKRPIKTREVYRDSKSNVLAMPTEIGPGRRGQGMMSNNGLSSVIDLLHFGFKINGRWIDDLVHEQRFTPAETNETFRGHPILLLKGKDSLDRPTSVWLSPHFGMLCVRSSTEQGDGTSLYFDLKDLKQFEKEWFPNAGEWGVRSSDGKPLSVGLLKADRIEALNEDSALLEPIKYPEQSTVADADTGQFYRVVDGKLVPFDPRKERDPKTLISGWIFFAGGLLLLGVILRLILVRNSLKASK